MSVGADELFEVEWHCPTCHFLNSVEVERPKEGKSKQVYTTCAYCRIRVTFEVVFKERCETRAQLNTDPEVIRR